MSFDTAEKRRSAAQMVTGLFPPTVTPNTLKDTEWRAQVCWGYSGVLVGALPTRFDTVGYHATTLDRNRTRFKTQRDRYF